MSASLIKVDINRGKLVKFELDIRGLDRNLLNGKLMIEVNGIEYGFPAVVMRNTVEVKIPCLFDVIYNIETYKTYIKAYLVLFSEFQYFVPWEGKLKVLTPKSVTAKLKRTAKKPVVQEIEFEELSEEEVVEDQEIIVDEPEPEHAVDLPQPTAKEKKTPIVAEKKKVTRKPQNESVILSEDQRHEYLEKLKNIDENGIRDYMARAGTKNIAVQDVILEQAENKCPDPDDKFLLLKSVIKVMNDLKKGPKNV